MSELETKAFIRTRGSIKARLTSFKKYIEKLIKPVDTYEAIDEAVIIETEQCLQKIEELFYEFEKCQSEIERRAEEEEIFEEQVKQRAIFEENYFSIVSSAKKFITNARQIRVEPYARANSGSIHSVQMQRSIREAYHDLGVRLPKISLPYFDDAYSNWSVFYDTFQSLILYIRAIKSRI